MWGMFHSLWRYRQFVLSSIRNEVLTHLLRSKLGFMWMIINPLAQALIYALILSNILTAKFPDINNKYAYSIYLMSGLLAWTLLSEIISRCLKLFIEQGNLMKKIHFPRITLPCIVIGSCLVNYSLLLFAIVVIFLSLGHQVSIALLWLIPLTLTLITLALGLGLIFGVLNVFLRDIGQVVPIILQIWFWFTPIVYPQNIIPENYHTLLTLNPLYSIIDGFHQVLAYNKAPEISNLFIIFVIALLLLFLSLFLFRRASSEMMDAL